MCIYTYIHTRICAQYLWTMHMHSSIARASLVAQLVKNLPAIQETWFDFWVGMIPWRRDRLPTPVFLSFPGSSDNEDSACNVGDLGSVTGLGRFPAEGIGHPLQYSWASLAAQTMKNLPVMWETLVESLGWEDSLEESMATHSSILAWRIPWTEEPGGLQSMGSQKARHNWGTKHVHVHTHTHTHTRGMSIRAVCYSLIPPVVAFGQENAV